MSSAISPSTRFCAPVGLNGSISLICSRTRSVSSNAIPGYSRALARFNSSPHSSQKNSSKISRNCAGERNEFSSRRSESGGGKCSPRMALQRSGSFNWCRMCGGRGSSHRRRTLQNPMDQRAKHTRVDLPRRFVDRNHAAGMQRRVAVVIARKISYSGCIIAMPPSRNRTPPCRTSATFSPGARISFRYPPWNHFPVQDCPDASVKVASNMPKPRRRKPATRVGAHLGQDGSHFAGSQRADLLDVTAVFVAKRGVSKEVLEDLKALGLQHRRARRAHAFHIHEWGEEIQQGLNQQQGLS